MRPFNLEEAKQGKPVQTRDGRAARIICFDAKGPDNTYIITLIYENDHECQITNNMDGTHWSSNYPQNDLVMKSEKKEGWINIYQGGKLFNSMVFATKNDALQHRRSDIVDTIYITWEE